MVEREITHGLIHLFFLAVPIGFAEFRLQNFPGPGERQRLGHEINTARAFETGNHLVTMGDQFLGARLLDFLKAHDRMNCFAPTFIRNTDDGTFNDRRVLLECVLYLGGVDVLATADDHILHPVDNEDIAPLVHVAAVARVHPAAAQRFGR